MTAGNGDHLEQVAESRGMAVEKVVVGDVGVLPEHDQRRDAGFVEKGGLVLISPYAATTAAWL